MSNSTPIVVPVYLQTTSAQATQWLRDGVPPTPQGSVLAWLAPWPPRPDTVWLVGAVDQARVRVADGDLALAATVVTAPELVSTLSAAYTASAAPLAEYRVGQYRHPQALVAGGLNADVLGAVEPNRADWQAGRQEYTRQLRQALRALIGAPADAPLAALVAAAVARGRARLIATYHDEGPVFYYNIDDGAWHFAHAIDEDRTG